MHLELLAQQVAVLRLQAQSLAAQAAAIEATVESLRMEPAGQAGCSHPFERREPVGNFGSTAWRCLACGATGDGA